MNVSLTPELEKWIEECVKSGLYASSSEVVRAGLRKLMQDPELPGWTGEQLRTAIAEGIAATDAGRVPPLSEVTVESVRRLAESRRSKS